MLRKSCLAPVVVLVMLALMAPAGSAFSGARPLTQSLGPTALNLHPDQAKELVRCAEEEMKKQRKEEKESIDSVNTPPKSVEDDSSGPVRPRAGEGHNGGGISGALAFAGRRMPGASLLSSFVRPASS